MEKTETLTFNAFKTLSVIEKDTILDTLFREETKIGYDILKKQAKKGELAPELEKTLKGIFDSIIIISSELPTLYNSIGLTTKKRAVKKEKDIPRRYGKSKIKADIKMQGGKPSVIQVTALKVQELKNLYVKLEARVNKRMFTDTSNLTDKDCRDINASIDTIIKKTKEALSK